MAWSYACRFWLIRVETFPFRCIFHYHSHLLFTSMKCSWDNCTTINFLRYKRVTAATLDAIFLIIYFSYRLKIDDDTRSHFCTQQKCGPENYILCSYFFDCILMPFTGILIRLYFTFTGLQICLHINVNINHQIDVNMKLFEMSHLQYAIRQPLWFWKKTFIPLCTFTTYFMLDKPSVFVIKYLLYFINQLHTIMCSS